MGTNFARGVLLTFLTQVVVFVFATVVGVLVTRQLGPEGKGHYFFAMSVSMALLMFIKSSIEVAGTYFVGKKGLSVKELPAQYLFISVIFSVISFIIIAVIWQLFSTSLFGNLEVNYLIIALLAIPFNLIILYFSSLYLLIGKVARYNKMLIIQNIITALLFVVLTLILKLGAIGALIAWTGGSILASVLIMGSINKIIQPTYTVKKKLIKSLFAFGIKGHIGEVADFFINRADSFFVNFFLGMTNVGYYSVAISAELLWYIPNSVISVLYPRLSHNNAHDSLNETKKACRITLFATFLPGLVMMFFAPSLIKTIFGQAFVPATIPFMIIIPGMVCLSVSKVLKVFLYSEGKPYIGTIASLITLTFNVVANIFFVPRFGLTGAALSVSLSYAIYSMTILLYFNYLYRARLSESLIVRWHDFSDVHKLLQKRK